MSKRQAEDHHFIGDGGAGGACGGVKALEYATDMAALPAHWKKMSGLSQRFSIFHQDSWNKSMTAQDTWYVTRILKDAFRWMHIDDMNHSLPAPAHKKPKHVLPFKVKDFYDLTMSDVEEEDDEEAGKDELEDDMPSEFSLGVVGEIVRQLAMHKMMRLVEVDQLQNTESWWMQKSFVEIHKLTAPYQTVYHGTCAENIEGITREGLRSMYSRRSAYGRGTYVSTCFETACSFAAIDANGVRHVVVARCHVGSVKQVGSDSAEHGFYASSDGILYNTKEVKRSKYLIVASDAQLVCVAILKTKGITVTEAQAFSDFSSLLTRRPSPLNHHFLGKSAGNVNTVSYNWSQNLVNMLAEIGKDNSAGAGSGSGDAVGGVANTPGYKGIHAGGVASVSGIGGIGSVGGINGISGIGGVGGIGGINGIGGVGGISGIGGVGGVGGVGSVGSVDNALVAVRDMMDRFTRQHTNAYFDSKIKLPSTYVSDSQQQKDAMKEKSRQDTLKNRQAALPTDNIDLPKFKLFLKGSVVVLKNLDKSRKYMEGAEGVVRLIVKECPSFNDIHIFMVEMKDHKLIPHITLANQRKEKKYKQTGYSRYGAQMQEHYLICKYKHMSLKDDKTDPQGKDPKGKESKDPDMKMPTRVGDVV